MKTVPHRIKEFNANRTEELVQIKYKLMSENPFRFFRGTCHLFYEDLHEANPLPPSPLAWICGDLHLENFGGYKGDNRLVYFDLNDFDEAILAPAILEIVRMATSILIAFDSLKIEQKKALKMAQVFLKNYSAVLAKGKALYIEPNTANGIVQTFLTELSLRKQKNILKKRTVRKRDQLAIYMEDPRHFELDKFLKRELSLHISQWIMYNNDSPYNYEVVDAAFRLAGTGSVGLKRYMFLLRSLRKGKKYIIVDMKQAFTSSLAPYVGLQQPQWETQAQRIASVQQWMQNISPALLSTTMFKDEPYILQEMQPTKDSFNFNLIKDRYRDMYQVIDDMALLTASSQLRSSGRQGAAVVDELISFGKNEQWQQTVLDYAVTYAKQVRKDYKTFQEALNSGYFS